uniref:Protein phosphatase 1 regulatory subunit 15A/B C-terminal domain-containing protein n=1 Tax=Amphiprion ocellaris TaxID=80972 RepID=A0A3Q1B7J4_AMPOC
MFRNVRSEGHLSGGHSPASSHGHGVSSPGLVSQESSWIGLLSRPALALLQNILTGPRVRCPALAEKGPGWLPTDLNSSFVNEENEFLRQLHDMMPPTQHLPPHLSYLRCDRGGPLEPRPGGASAWMTADSLREMGLQSATELDLNLCQQTQLGYFSSVRTFLNQVLLSSQDLRPPSDWVLEAEGPPAKGGAGRGQWGSFWGTEEGSQRGLLSDLSWAEDGTASGLLCPPAGTKAAPVFVPSREWMLGEASGPSPHKDQPANKGGLHTVQNTEGSGADLQLSIRTHLSSEVAVLTREQDHGYCSLEEEQLKARTLEEEPPAAQQDGSGGTVDLSAPQCQNKAIAFIMGCPCSDEDSSQSDGGDDDGFNSEGSSDLSESTGEDDDEDSELEVDSESERLWSSLCQSHDPYNPQNFTARLQSGTGPRSILGSMSLTSSRSSSQSSPASSISSSPPSGLDVWEDSASASEADEAESLRLWSSFSSSDPYSPFNFQAPLRTQGPAEAPSRAQTWGKKASMTPRPAPAPEYRREEAEERLDSCFSEPSRTKSCSVTKKVRFSDVIEEFFLGSEDRRGPWEELARDRCRFLRRCQEVEQSISYVLQPQHRRSMQQRMDASLQDV